MTRFRIRRKRADSRIPMADPCVRKTVVQPIVHLTWKVGWTNLRCKKKYSFKEMNRLDSTETSRCCVMFQLGSRLHFRHKPWGQICVEMKSVLVAVTPSVHNTHNRRLVHLQFCAEEVDRTGGVAFCQLYMKGICRVRQSTHGERPASYATRPVIVDGWLAYTGPQTEMYRRRNINVSLPAIWLPMLYSLDAAQTFSSQKQYAKRVSTSSTLVSKLCQLVSLLPPLRLT
jgi:hypothetical protein